MEELSILFKLIDDFINYTGIVIIFKVKNNKAILNWTSESAEFDTINQATEFMLGMINGYKLCLNND